MITKKSKIYVAGHNGMVGSAILKRLNKAGYKNLIYVNRSKLDLRNQKDTYNFLKKKTKSSFCSFSKSWRNTCQSDERSRLYK